MTEAGFWRSVRAVLPLLQEMRLGPEDYILRTSVSGGFRTAALDASVGYTQLFAIGLEGRDYCFLLNDLSYLQFGLNGVGRDLFHVRYGYYPNPFGMTSFEDFLSDFEVERFDPYAIELYQQFLSEQEPLDGIGPFRFEVDVGAHRPTLHPCAHLHIGHHTDVRMPVDKVLTPKAFALFMLKSHYPQQWRIAPAEPPSPPLTLFDQRLAAAKAECVGLEARFFGSMERAHPHLT